LAFDLSNEVTDTSESSTILIYVIQVAGIFIHKRVHRLKQEINKEECKGDNLLIIKRCFLIKGRGSKGVNLIYEKQATNFVTDTKMFQSFFQH